ncbi:microtubule-associated protein [Anaeramoeba flamelloides]|uniref:Microtubule-associated protein n=1 Tax=Anaeramoeba flamelloides TaxID=1746091 RepID=A0ABQ8YRW5_9EUKA|nr:microtubule-associated protein [Anaeramoeba flamelloides]
MSIKKKNLKVQKKKERNRTSCKSYYPDEVEEITFGTATEEEQLALIDISCMRKREDRIKQLFSFFPNDIMGDCNGEKIEFTARLINLLCYALGQGRTNVRSCLGSHFKRKGYRNLTVRKKNTGMVFVQKGFVEEKVKKDKKQKQKQKQEQEQEQEQKQEQDQKIKVREQKRRKKRVFVETLPLLKEEGEKTNENKKRKTNRKTKQTRMTRAHTRVNTRTSKRTYKKAIINPKLENNTNNSNNTNDRDSTTDSSLNNNTNSSSSNNNNDNQTKNNSYNDNSNTNVINDQFEDDLISPDHDSLLYNSFWVELPQNSNNLESDPHQGFSPVNTSMLSEIQFENELTKPFELTTPYQFENEDFSSFLLAIDNEFESTNLQFD